MSAPVCQNGREVPAPIPSNAAKLVAISIVLIGNRP